ncbi:hypothetical protein RchiOBHm_Chr2g0102881 [Rosa chinensis]|uniref:Uncharacterized protein n=1 Tax=Rosa chinensis TaxID=74649 RepID=A0A2P6RMS6_ROSCH|nr:hypothetical protein RchiOBHm_Chr2g0102881 [Rosa chinensis]
MLLSYFKWPPFMFLLAKLYHSTLTIGIILPPTTPSFISKFLGWPDDLLVNGAFTTQIHMIFGINHYQCKGEEFCKNKSTAKQEIFIN